MELVSLPSDIIKIIHDELDFTDQSNFILTSIQFNIYPITNLLDCFRGKHKLNNSICQSN